MYNNINPMLRGMPLSPISQGINPINRSLLKGNILSKGNILKGINYQNILGNVSKTIGVVKDAIPVVKEVRPMIGNMKSMLKIASVFSDVTDANDKKQTIIENKNKTNELLSNNNSNDNEPNFFL